MESLALKNLRFEDKEDFKSIMQSLITSKKLKKISIENMVFEHDMYGRSIGHLLSLSQTIYQLELQNVSFEHPRSFYEMCQPLLKRQSRIAVLKIRGVLITTLEARVLQYILMNNK